MKQTLIVLVSFFFSVVVCKTITMSPTGTYKTLNSASAVAVAGDVIEIESGIYNTTQYTSSLKGSSALPILVHPASNAHVIFDGSNCDPMFWLSGMSYVTFDGEGRTEIRNTKNIKQNGGGHGISIPNADHVTIKGLEIHHTYANGMYVYGKDLVIRDNKVHDCVLMNEFGNGTHGWGQSIGTSSISKGVLSERILIENNTVTESWGEGIDLLYCDNCVARGNTVRNAYSVMLYMDNSRNLLFERNVIYSTNHKYDRYSTQAAISFGIGTESHGNISAINITIRDNLSIGPSGIYSINAQGYYAQVRIVHNTFYGANGGPIMLFHKCVASGKTHDNEVSNNVFYSTNQYWNADMDSVEVHNWTVFSNVFLGISTVPLADTIYPGSSIAISGRNSTLLFNHNDGNWCFNPECFRPLCSGYLKNKGKHSNFVSTTDFFGEYRSNTPSIGFAQNCEPTPHSNDNNDDGSDANSKTNNSFKNIFPLCSFIITLLTIIL